MPGRPDYSKSLGYFQKAADLNYQTAFNELGLFYLSVQQNYSKALGYFQKAASLNVPAAYNNLGYLYQNGLGVEKNKLKAIECYQKAVDLGFNDARYELNKLRKKSLFF